MSKSARKGAAWLFPLLLAWRPLAGMEVTQTRRIVLPQDKAVLMAAESLVKTEDDIFIIPDSKDGNLKLYDADGNLVRVWGQRGPGPEEFLSPRSCDYRKPMLVVSDFAKRRIMVFSRVGRDDFAKVSEFAFPLLDKYNLKWMDDRLLISGYVPVSDQEAYGLISRDMKSGAVRNILPNWAKYGFSSFGSYDSKKHTVLPLGSAGFCDSAGKFIYFAWEGDLKVIKIHRDSGARESFGVRTGDYRPPKVTRALETAFRVLSAEDVDAEYAKMSFVTGLFADKDFVGVVYQNFDKKDALWKMRLQLYAPDGELITEQALPDAVTYVEFRACNSFYDPTTRTLYYLSIRYEEASGLDRYEIVAFKIG